MTCEHCGIVRPVMVDLAGGRGLPPFWLCSSCWLEGVRKPRAGDGEPAKASGTTTEPPKTSKQRSLLQ